MPTWRGPKSIGVFAAAAAVMVQAAPMLAGERPLWPSALTPTAKARTKSNGTLADSSLPTKSPLVIAAAYEEDSERTAPKPTPVVSDPQPPKPLPKIEAPSRRSEAKTARSEFDGLKPKQKGQAAFFRKVRPNDLSLLPEPPSPFENATFPTVVHVGHSLLVAVPCGLAVESTLATAKMIRSHRPIAEFRTVALRGVAGTNAGKVVCRPVIYGRAAFAELLPGAYDVYYLRDAKQNATVAELPPAPTRRILLESDRFPMPTAAAPWEKSESPMDDRPQTASWRSFEAGDDRLDLKQADASEIADLRIRAGWILLEKGSLFAARKKFAQAYGLLRDGKPEPQAAAELTIDPAAVVVAAPEAVSALRQRTIMSAQLAKALAAVVQNRKKFSGLFYGMAKCYDAIWLESETALDGGEHLAEVCYWAALELDSANWRAGNDLAVLLARRGELDRAAECLIKTADGKPEAPVAYNLGCVLALQNKVDEARQCWAFAFASDTRFLSPLNAWLASTFDRDASALYPEDCAALAQSLALLRDGYGADSVAGKRVQELLGRLEVVGRELELNGSSRLGRYFWLAVAPRRNNDRSTFGANGRPKPIAAPVASPAIGDRPILPMEIHRLAPLPTAAPTISRNDGEAKTR